MKNAHWILFALLALVAGLFLGRCCSTPQPEIVEKHQSDTVTIIRIDTVVVERPVPVKVVEKRTDTITVVVNNGKVTSIQPYGSGSKEQTEPVKGGMDTMILPVKGDEEDVSASADSGSMLLKVPIPISLYIFRDSLYYLKVSGYHVTLDRLEVYPQTVYKTITNTTERTIQEKKRWGIGLQAGYGYNFGSGKAGPYVGIGVQYNIVQW